MSFVSTAREKIVAFLATPFGHAVEHAVTAAALTAAGLVVAKFVAHKPVTIEDVRDAVTLFVSSVGFGLRTALREFLKPADDPTKLSRKGTQHAIVAASKRKHAK